MNTSEELPVPAVHGGLIEQLVTILVEENARHKKLDLTVVSKYDRDALLKRKKFSNCS